MLWRRLGWASQTSGREGRAGLGVIGHSRRLCPLTRLSAKPASHPSRRESGVCLLRKKRVRPDTYIGSGVHPGESGAMLSKSVATQMLTKQAAAWNTMSAGGDAPKMPCASAYPTTTKNLRIEVRQAFAPCTASPQAESWEECNEGAHATLRPETELLQWCKSLRTVDSEVCDCVVLHQVRLD